VKARRPPAQSISPEIAGNVSKGEGGSVRCVHDVAAAMQRCSCVRYYMVTLILIVTNVPLLH
jgi:hypothetical protein